MIHVESEFMRFFPEQKVDEFFAIPGTTAKAIQNRVTRRVERDNRVFFIKCHEGIGWAEVFKNLISMRLPVISAANEWRAIQKLRALGVDTMGSVAYGEEGRPPAAVRSFLVTESLEHTTDLENWCGVFRRRPDRAQHLATWRSLLRRVGDITGRMHHGGVNHRDYYLCHLRMDLQGLEVPADAEHTPLYVMDLHRAQMRRRTPDRWAVKDLAGLLYSALHGPAGLQLSRTELACFLAGYLGPGWKQAMRQRASFWARVGNRYRHDCRRHRQTPARLLG